MSISKVDKEKNIYYCSYIVEVSDPVKWLKISAKSEEEAKSKAKDYLHRVEGDSLKYISIVTPDDFYYYKTFQWIHGIEVNATEVE